MKSIVGFPKILLVYFAFIAFLIFCRYYFTGDLHFVFLIWNLFLAWVPFYVSFFFKKKLSQPSWKLFITFLIWLLFFPNALYIVTDLIHLSLITQVPKWFDVILLFSASFAGLIMAFASLLNVENVLKHFFSRPIVKFLIIVILFLGSFGVYLGRFLRWNSWDILNNPITLLSTIFRQVLFPFQHTATWGITLLLTVLYYLIYITIKKMPGYMSRANILNQ